MNLRAVTTGLVLAFAILWGPVATPAVQAQTQIDSSYTITVEDRTDEHPWTGRDNAYSEVFAVDGVQGDTLFLHRDSTYQFVMDGVPEFHPFYLSESEVGSGGEIYTQGVSSTNPDHEDRAWDSDTLTFTPEASTPDTLYYQCVNHDYMGGTLVITGETATTTPGDPRARELPTRFHLRGNYPNPFNPATRIQFALPAAARVEVEVFDALGRKVKTVDAGRLPASSRATVRVDLSGQPSGLYLYRVRARGAERNWRGTGQMTLLK